MLVGTTGATKDDTYDVASDIQLAYFGVYSSVALTNTVEGVKRKREDPAHAPHLAEDSPFCWIVDTFRSFRPQVGTMGAACGPYDGRCLLWLEMPLEMPPVVGDALFDRGCPMWQGMAPLTGQGMPSALFVHKLVL